MSDERRCSCGKRATFRYLSSATGWHPACDECWVATLGVARELGIPCPWERLMNAGKGAA